ncbi:MAG: TRAP transporter substrate-binding protein DctP [Gammaproteobacteria bacterium]|nr:TRAP transporter substrate-binding protein DctP [Gammaproteobacteria bacterium]
MLISNVAIARTIKIATLAPDGTNWMKQMRKGAAVIAERTQGRVKFKFYPGGVMGGDASVHRKIRIGQLHGGAFTSGGLSGIYPDIQIYSLPMIFDSFAEVDYVRSKMDVSLKQGMREKGFELLGISEGGFARILSTEALGSLSQIRKKKVWAPEGDALVLESFKTLGVSPISLPISDVYTGLQTGLIDTISANSTAAIAFQWHSKVSYVTDVPLIYIVGSLIVDSKTFKKISKPDQAIVKEEMVRVFKYLDKINRTDNKDATEALRAQGITFIPLEKYELVLWKTMAEKAIKNLLAADAISDTKLNVLKSHLAEYRNKH